MTLAGVLSLSPQWSDADASWLLLGVFQHNEGARVSLGSSPFPVLRDPTKATKGGCATSSSSFGLQTGRKPAGFLASLARERESLSHPRAKASFDLVEGYDAGDL